MRVEFHHFEIAQTFEDGLSQIEQEAFTKCLRYIGGHVNPDRIRTFFFRTLDAIVLFAYRDTQFIITYQWMQRTVPNDATLLITLTHAMYTKDSSHAFDHLQDPL